MAGRLARFHIAFHLVPLTLRAGLNLATDLGDVSGALLGTVFKGRMRRSTLRGGDGRRIVIGVEMRATSFHDAKKFIACAVHTTLKKVYGQPSARKKEGVTELESGEGLEMAMGGDNRCLDKWQRH